MGKKLSSFAIVTLLLTATTTMTRCTAPMDVDVRDADSRLVIYSTLMDVADFQCVYVERTTPVFSAEQDSWVSDARVSISTSEGETHVAQWEAEQKCYIAKQELKIKPEVTYTLNVYYDMDADGDVKHYTASTTTIKPLELDSIKVKSLVIMDEKMYRLAIFGKEPAGPNYYVFRIGVNGEIKKPKLKNWIVVDDKLFDGNGFYNYPMGVYMSEPDADLSNIYFTPGDSISLFLANVDEGFMNFARESKRSGKPNNPLFGTPPFNIRSNISNGALGYFGSLCSSVIHTKVPHDAVPIPL